MCCQPNGAMRANRPVGYYLPVGPQLLHGPAAVFGVPEDHRGRRGIRTSGSVPLDATGAVPDLPVPVEEQRAGQGDPRLSLVEPSVRAAAQRRVGDPIDRAQGALIAPDLGTLADARTVTGARTEQGRRRRQLRTGRPRGSPVRSSRPRCPAAPATATPGGRPRAGHRLRRWPLPGTHHGGRTGLCRCECAIGGGSADTGWSPPFRP